MIARLTWVPTCPDLPLAKIISINQHWTDPIVEFFGEDPDKPTHMHVYRTVKAREGFREGRFTIPPTVTTVSYEDSTF